MPSHSRSMACRCGRGGTGLVELVGDAVEHGKTDRQHSRAVNQAPWSRQRPAGTGPQDAIDGHMRQMSRIGPSMPASSLTRRPGCDDRRKMSAMQPRVGPQRVATRPVHFVPGLQGHSPRDGHLDVVPDHPQRVVAQPAHPGSARAEPSRRRLGLGQRPAGTTARGAAPRGRPPVVGN